MGFDLGNALAAVQDIHAQTCLRRLARSHSVDSKTLSTLVRNNASTFDMTITRNWTAGVHTFSAQDVHNAGVSLGTSGRLNSAVADGAGVSSFLYQPSVALTSGTDRYVHRWLESSGTYGLQMNSDFSFQFLGNTGSNLSGGYIIINQNIGEPVGIFFGPTINASTGMLIAGKPNTIAGAAFIASHISNAAPAGYVVGGYFASKIASAVSGNVPIGYVAAFFRSGDSMFGAAGTQSALTFAQLGGWRVVAPSAAKNAGTFTDVYGGYIENATEAVGGIVYTNVSGLIIEEQTGGATINNGIRLLNATSGRKLITFGDQANYITGVNTGTATMDIVATTLNLNSTNLGFYGIAGVARPTSYTQTYATASKTHSNLTATTVATTAATNVTPYGYMQAQADAIPMAINALLTDLTNLKQVVNSLIDDGQALGLLQ